MTYNEANIELLLNSMTYNEANIELLLNSQI